MVSCKREPVVKQNDSVVFIQSGKSKKFTATQFGFVTLGVTLKWSGK